VHKDDYDKCLETYVKAFDKREAFYMEYRLMDKHGEYRWIGDHGRPFYDVDDKTFLGYIGSCYDITDNKLYEQKLEKVNETKDKFFQIVAHDLRNPIATFVSVSEYLMENHNDFDQEEMTEIATQMHEDSRNTLLLLENLLDWSRAQSDVIKFQPEALDLYDLVQEVVAQVDLCAKAKKITIDCFGQNQKDRLPSCSNSSNGNSNKLLVHADKNMIKTVLRNLLMNAIKFTHQGGTIRVHAERNQEETASEGTESHQSATFVISDSGVGFSEDNVEDLFDLPSGGSHLGTDFEGGSGLGLVICKEFIDKHQGKIWATSVKGKGTDFYVTIPSLAAEP